jgi:hypothetical protein
MADEGGFIENALDFRGKVSHILGNKTLDYTLPMLLIVALLFIFQDPALEDSPRDTEYVERPDNTYWVTCGEPARKVIARSQTLIAPRSRASAFVRVTASPDGMCSNRSELLVRRRGDRSFRVVHTVTPSEFRRGNGLKPVDWSPGGRYLVLDLIEWQYGSDSPVDRNVVLYDSTQNQVRVVDTDHVFEGEPKDCLTEVRALGFRDEAAIMVRVKSQPFYEVTEEEPVNPKCRTYTRTFEISLDGSGARQIDGNVHVNQFATRRNQ